VIGTKDLAQQLILLAEYIRIYVGDIMEHRSNCENLKRFLRMLKKRQTQKKKKREKLQKVQKILACCTNKSQLAHKHPRKKWKRRIGATGRTLGMDH
jgi:hypothetical protein